MPTAPDSVWDTYIKSHPAAEKFRIHGIANYSILHELCANMTATGEFALTTIHTFSGSSDGIGLGGLGGEGLLTSERGAREKENGKPGRVIYEKMKRLAGKRKTLMGRRDMRRKREQKGLMDSGGMRSMEVWLGE